MKKQNHLILLIITIFITSIISHISHAESFDKLFDQMAEEMKMETDRKAGATQTSEQKQWQFLKIPDIIEKTTGASISMFGATLNTISSDLVSQELSAPEKIIAKTIAFFGGSRSYRKLVSTERYHARSWYYAAAPNSQQLSCIVKAANEIKQAVLAAKAASVPGPYRAHMNIKDLSSCSEAYNQKGNNPIHGKTCADLIKNSPFSEEQLTREMKTNEGSDVVPKSEIGKDLPRRSVYLKTTIRPTGECVVTSRDEILGLWIKEAETKKIATQERQATEAKNEEELAAQKKAFDELNKIATPVNDDAISKSRKVKGSSTNPKEASSEGSNCYSEACVDRGSSAQ